MVAAAVQILRGGRRGAVLCRRVRLLPRPVLLPRSRRLRRRGRCADQASRLTLLHCRVPPPGGAIGCGQLLTAGQLALVRQDLRRREGPMPLTTCGARGSPRCRPRPAAPGRAARRRPDGRPDAGVASASRRCAVSSPAVRPASSAGRTAVGGRYARPLPTSWTAPSIRRLAADTRRPSSRATAKPAIPAMATTASTTSRSLREMSISIEMITTPARVAATVTVARRRSG
jgi:hypothetical protein